MKRTLPAAAFLLLAAITAAHAQSSLGIGTNEATVPPTGLFSGLLAWINTAQQDFYRALTGSLKAMREDPSRLTGLIGLSFAYGVFHAAGPGHGKAVISSYILANETTLRRGVYLSFVSAFLQAATAIVVMGAAFTVLRGSALSMTNAAWGLEIISYAAISAYGAWLLARKLTRPRAVLVPAGHVHYHDHHDHDHGPDCDCGHSHAPDPASLKGDRLTLGAAWAAVWAVGLRPCSGALIVLTFAFLNGLFLGGILSALAMALGTAITVSALAVLAVTAKSAAVRYSGGMGDSVHSAVEIGGAVLVMGLGLLLLTASLSA